MNIKKFFERSRVFFRENDKEIKVHNWKQIRIMTMLYASTLVAFFLIVCLPMKNTVQMEAVVIAFIAQYCFTIIVLLQKEPPKAEWLENLYLRGFGGMIMALGLALGVFIFPMDGAWLYPIELILLTQIYTMRPVGKCVELTLYAVIFILCSWLNKPAYYVRTDVLSVIVAYGIALVSYFTLLWYKIEAAESEDKYKHLVAMDTLTGLLNKAAFKQRYSAYLEDRPVGQNYALAVVDIDAFKMINDNHGHIAGDEVLKDLAGSVKRYFSGRAHAVAGRFGGDEFTILVTDAGEMDKAQHLFEDFRISMKQWMAEKHDYGISLSVGAVLMRERTEFRAAFEEGDRLLYQVKQKGGDGLMMEELLTSWLPEGEADLFEDIAENNNLNKDLTIK